MNEPTILFRCDGSSEIGLGHVVRCLALADELVESHGCRAVFAIRSGPPAIEMVGDKGFLLVTPDAGSGFDYAQWLGDAVAGHGARALVLDVRDDLSRAVLEQLRRQGVLIVVLDDGSDRRLAADLAFYPPVPQVHRLDWSGFRGELFVGWEWVILRREFACRPARQPGEKPIVLVTAGGSDPAGITLKAVRALDHVDGDFETFIVLGRAFAHNEALAELLSRTRRRFNVRRSVEDISTLMAQADLAIATFGITAYELAAMGVPAIYCCLTEDHAESARSLIEAGAALSLGLADSVTVEHLAEAVAMSLRREQLSRIAEAAASEVDGMGARRIAVQIAQKLSGAKI